MRKLLHITFNDLRVSFAESGILINLIVIPIALIIAIGFAQGGFGNQTPTTRLDVLALEANPNVDELIAGIRAINPDLTLCPYDGAEACALDAEVTFDEALLQSRVAQGTSNGALIIPPDFADALLSGQAITLPYLTRADPLQPSALLQIVEAVLNRMAGASIASQVSVMVYENAGFVFADTASESAFRQAVYDHASEQWRMMPSLVDYVTAGENTSSGGGSGFQQSVPGMGSMYVMFTVLAGVSTLLLERKHWTLQRMMMMPVTRAQFIGGKLFARFIMGMIQFAVAFMTGIMLGVNLGSDAIALLLIMVAFVACIASLTFLLATFVRTDHQAGTMIIFIGLTLAPLGGAWWPLEIVPDFMKTIAYLTPVGWAMDGFTKIIFYGGSVTNILLNVGVLLAISVVLFTFATRRFAYD